MKKVFSILILGILLVGFVGIGVENILAQGGVIDPEAAPKASECCKIRHTIRVGGETFSEGWVVGPDKPPGVPINCGLPGFVHGTPYWAGICTIDSVQTISDWIFWIAFVITGVALIFAGVTFVTAGGSPDRVSRAKKIFLYSLIGVFIVVAAEFIPALFRFFIGI